MIIFSSFGLNFRTGVFYPTIDTAPPVLAGQPTIDISGLILTITYNELLDESSVPATSAYSITGTSSTVSAVNVSGNSVILTLSTAVLVSQTVTLTYTSPGSGKIRDIIGNNAANISSHSVTNNSTVSTGDTIAPIIVTVEVDTSGLTLVITYNELLDTLSIPDPSSFIINGAGGIQVSSVNIIDYTVILNLEAEVLEVSTISLDYTPPISGKIRDVSGNNANSFSAYSVTNNSIYFDRIYSIPNGVFSFDSVKSELVVTNAGFSDPSDISKASWTKTQMTATSSSSLTVDSGATAPLVQQIINNCGNGNPCIPVLYSFRVKTTGYDFVCVETRSGLAANRTWFNVTSGTVGTNGANHTNATIGDADESGYRLVYLLCIVNGGTPLLIIRPCTADNVTTSPSSGSILDIKQDSTYSGWVYQQRISAWYDRVSGEPLILDPGIISARVNFEPGFGTHPLIDKCGINNTPALRSVGSQWLVSSSATDAISMLTGSGLAWTILMVIQPDIDDADAAMVSWGNGASTNGATSFGFGNSGFGRHRAFFKNDAASLTENEASSDMTSDRSPKKIIWRSNGTTISCRENGNSIPLANSVAPPGAFTPNKLGIFATASNGAPNRINGRLAIFEGYSRDLTDTECSQIEADILSDLGI